MTPAIKLGLIIGMILGLSPLLGLGLRGPAAVLGTVAIVSFVHGLVAWSRARLPWFGWALIVNAISAVLLALLLVLADELSFPWLIGVGTGVLVGLLVSAWLIQRQGHTSPTTWLELTRELEGASVADLLLGRPLTALGGRARS